MSASTKSHGAVVQVKMIFSAKHLCRSLRTLTLGKLTEQTCYHVGLIKIALVSTTEFNNAEDQKSWSYTRAQLEELPKMPVG